MTSRPDVVVDVVDNEGAPVREVAFAALEQQGRRWDLLPLDVETTASISPDGRHRLAGLTERQSACDWNRRLWFRVGRFGLMARWPRAHT